MQKLAELHRHHVGTKTRDSRRDVSLNGFDETGCGFNLSASLTTPSELAMRNERLVNLELALSKLTSTDREVIIMRHFEELTNVEVAHILSVSPPAVSQRMRRALRHLREELCKISDDFDKS